MISDDKLDFSLHLCQSHCLSSFDTFVVLLPFIQSWNKIYVYIFSFLNNVCDPEVVTRSVKPKKTYHPTLQFPSALWIPFNLFRIIVLVFWLSYQPSSSRQKKCRQITLLATGEELNICFQCVYSLLKRGSLLDLMPKPNWPVSLPEPSA